MTEAQGQVVPTPRAAPTEVPVAEEDPQDAPPEVFEAPHRIVIHFNPNSSVSADTASRIASALEEAGASSVQSAGVALFVSRTHVRAFHTEDTELATLVAQIAGAGVQVRDFTNYTPRPLPGLIEIWLSAE